MKPMDSTPSRMILHADTNAFYASIEQRDDVGPRGRPVAVGSAGARLAVIMAIPST